MNQSAINREDLKVVLKEILREEPTLLKDALLKIIEEEAGKDKEDEFSAALEMVFKKHGETLRRLA